MNIKTWSDVAPLEGEIEYNVTTNETVVHINKTFHNIEVRQGPFLDISAFLAAGHVPAMVDTASRHAVQDDVSLRQAMASRSTER